MFLVRILDVFITPRIEPFLQLLQCVLGYGRPCSKDSWRHECLHDRSVGQKVRGCAMGAYWFLNALTDTKRLLKSGKKPMSLHSFIPSYIRTTPHNAYTLEAYRKLEPIINAKSELRLLQTAIGLSSKAKTQLLRSTPCKHRSQDGKWDLTPSSKSLPWPPES